jgi:hypothetical protein
VPVDFDINSHEGKETFRRYDNGQFKDKSTGAPLNPITRHPNIVKGVITGKKSWGLHVKMWSEGIGEWCFTKDEIVQTFTDKGIKIPDSLLKDFENHIIKQKQKRYF